MATAPAALKKVFYKERKEGNSMENDGEYGDLQFLRGAIKEAAEECQDPDLLDLVYRLLLNG